ncbi:5'-nucleotidase [Cutibacterium acnes JCM 18909]|nr:5'-nucleotidase [Cutibacterium acnes JCM 18909]
MGSGSFLIAGRDNFTELARGSKPVDSGKINLSAWVDWIKAHKTLKPDFAKRAVSLTTSLHEGTSRDTTFTLGKPADKAVAPDTVDFTSKDAVVNTIMKPRSSRTTRPSTSPPLRLRTAGPPCPSKCRPPRGWSAVRPPSFSPSRIPAPRCASPPSCQYRPAIILVAL